MASFKTSRLRRSNTQTTELFGAQKWARNLTAARRARANPGFKDQLRDGMHSKLSYTIRGFINVDWQIYLCASALVPVSSVEVFPGWQQAVRACFGYSGPLRRHGRAIARRQ